MSYRFCTLAKTKQCFYLRLKYGFKSTSVQSVCLKSRPIISGFSNSAWCCALENDKKKTTSTLENDKKASGTLISVYKKYEQKYLNYIEKRYPRYYKVNMQVITGAKTTWKDAKYRLHLQKKIKESGISYLELPWQDIMFIRQFRRDLIKVTPTLILSLFPVVFYGVLVVVALKPRLLLSQQFFTAEQQNKYRVQDHQHRVKSNPKVLEHLKETKCNSTEHQQILYTIVTKVDGGRVTTVQDLLNSSQLFTQLLNIANLHRNQLVDICKLLAIKPHLQPSFLLRRRLTSSLLELRTIDKGINESDLQSLDLQQLQRICFDRGFYTHDGSGDKVFSNWLRSWIELSVKIPENEMSLLGYAAFLLVVNQTPE